MNKKIRTIILICNISICLGCQKNENNNKQKMMNLNLKKATLFRSHWKEGKRAQVGQYLFQHLKIGMKKKEVAKILGYPTQDGDSINKSEGSIEKWFFTINLARCISLTFDHEKLVHIDGG